jgi:glycosyltransferase involved in cell wall biosynthesis
MEISVVLPCLNEEETIGTCVHKASQALRDLGLRGEVVVCDNGSTDASARLAQTAGAKVVFQPQRGYGNAYLKGLEAARARYIVMADADDSYDLSQLGLLIEKLRQGFDLVIGSRFKGKILPGAMSWSHRYIGNPILTGTLNLFFKARISDAHSGFRAIKREALDRLALSTGGMEFASEMIIQALRENLKIVEVPIVYHPRKGVSKLAPLSDAWRHLRFMLLFSPTYLFLFPGGFLFILGLCGLVLFLPGRFSLFGHRFDVHAMVFASLFSILGFQIITLGLYAKTYALLEGYERENKLLKMFYRRFKLEKGLALGLGLFLLGVSINIYIVYKWVKGGLGSLNEARGALFALTFTVIGLQTVFSSFFLSMLGIQRHSRPK